MNTKLKDIRDIDKNMKELTINEDDDTIWYEVNAEVINKYMQGKAFKNGEFNRLNDVYVSENVETLKHHPAGFNLEFKAKTNTIKLKAKLAGAAYMSHMTAVGTIGFSLYVKKCNKWYFVNSSKINKSEYEVDLLTNINNKEYTYRLYFPLYQALYELSLGVKKPGCLEFIKEDRETLLIYGTSISQGGCATRPGMDYGAILGRMKNLNVINLGFSGSCKIEQSMCGIINDIVKENNVKKIIFEVECNSPSYDHFKTRFSYLLDNLYNKENIEIYLISHFDEALPFVNNKIKKYRKGFREVQEEVAKKYNIHYIDGIKITKGIDCEGSVDGVHLTDLGFYEVAKKLAKII
jgi:hypothetical protein